MGVKRTTFIIDENGNIETIIDKVKTKSIQLKFCHSDI